MSAAMDMVLPDHCYVSSNWNADVQITRRPVTTSASPAVPQWASVVVKRLNDLLRLRENWDSYGAVKPSADAAVALVKVLCDISNPDTPPPAIVPSAAGHFQAEWHQDGIDLEVEVMSPTKISASYSDASGHGWEDDLSLDVTRLARAVRQLGRTAA